jgi:hypothetical protein
MGQLIITRSVRRRRSSSRKLSLLFHRAIANRQKPAAAAAANDYTANTSSVNESNYAALPKLQREIMELVAKDDTDEGMHVSAVSRGVSGMGQYSGDKVM